MNRQTVNIRRNFRLVAVALCLASASVASVALAQSVHLKGGRNAEPSFIDQGLTLQATASVSGLGEGNVVVAVSATGNVDSTCTNKGGTSAPGQNPAQVTLVGATEIPEGEIKNGNLTFTVATQAPQSPIPGAPGCANPNWVQTIDDIHFTSATITVRQPAETVVLTVSCTFSPATSDGAVPSGTVTCSSVSP